MASRFLETISIEDVLQIFRQMRYSGSIHHFCSLDWRNSKNLLYIDIRQKGENQVEDIIKVIKHEKLKMVERGYEPESALNILGVFYIGKGAPEL